MQPGCIDLDETALAVQLTGSPPYLAKFPERADEWRGQTKTLTPNAVVMCIAVVDSCADLKAFVRMNGAWVGSIDIAIKNAKTACFFGINTRLIGLSGLPSHPWRT